MNIMQDMDEWLMKKFILRKIFFTKFFYEIEKISSPSL